MAKIVEGKLTKRNYPWDTWFDGREWELKYREDFRPTPYTMQQMVCHAARRMGIEVRTRIYQEYLYVQAIRDTNRAKKGTGTN